MNILKTSLAMIAFGFATSCSKTEMSDANTAQSAATPAETSAMASDAPDLAVPGPVAVSDYDASSVSASGGNCALDAINGGATPGVSVKAGSDVTFGGWIADAANQVPREAKLILKGANRAYSAPLAAGAERVDVAAALKADSLRLSGYNVTAKLDVIPDSYELSILHGSGAEAASCALNASLTVTN